VITAIVVAAIIAAGAMGANGFLLYLGTRPAPAPAPPQTRQAKPATAVAVVVLCTKTTLAADRSLLKRTRLRARCHGRVTTQQQRASIQRELQTTDGVMSVTYAPQAVMARRYHGQKVGGASPTDSFLVSMSGTADADVVLSRAIARETSGAVWTVVPPR
jgi:hypothetical protein